MLRAHTDLRGASHMPRSWRRRGAVDMAWNVRLHVTRECVLHRGNSATSRGESRAAMATRPDGHRTTTVNGGRRQSEDSSVELSRAQTSDHTGMDLLRCPECRGSLVDLACVSCGAAYGAPDGIPDLLGSGPSASRY